MQQLINKRASAVAMGMQRWKQSRGGDEFDLLHAANPAQIVAQLAQAGRRSLDKENLERLVVFKKDVLGGNHLLQVSGLGSCQRVAHPPALGAVDQCDGARDDRILLTSDKVRKLMAYQLGDHLRSA